MTESRFKTCLRLTGPVLALVFLACSPEKHAVQVATADGVGSHSNATASVATGSSTPLASTTPSASAPVEGWLPLEVSTEPFVFDPRFPDCIHPGVRQDCTGGWCNVPAGCYVFGSTEDTPFRNPEGEERGPITLTYDLEVMQFELTWTDYDRITDWPRKVYTGECGEDSCPAHLSWWEAMLLANLLSEQNNPPLEKCYDLGDTCHQSPGDRMWCPDYKLVRPEYKCTGYRIPNQFEWQYAARGGTSTHFYTGNMVNKGLKDCPPDRALEKIAWYCGNSPTFAAHPVGQLLPNRWGLYDVFGNVFETLQTPERWSPPYPAIDPVELDANGQRQTDIAGGNCVTPPAGMQVAKYILADFAGLRLVRTRGPGVLPTLKR